MASVTVKNCKKLAFGPTVANLLRRLLDIQYNRNTVFVVVSNDSLVSVSCIGLNHAVLLCRAFCLFVVWQLHIRNLQRILFGLLLSLARHFKYFWFWLRQKLLGAVFILVWLWQPGFGRQRLNFLLQKRSSRRYSIIHSRSQNIGTDSCRSRLLHDQICLIRCTCCNNYSSGHNYFAVN
jgi:hypothetical protein